MNHRNMEGGRGGEPKIGDDLMNARFVALSEREICYRTRAIAQQFSNHSSLSDGFIRKKSVAIHSVSFTFRTAATARMKPAEAQQATKVTCIGSPGSKHCFR